MKKFNKKGFTIVELVIVIAVIAILAAVLIPTFSGIVERAQDSANLQDARNAYTELLIADADGNISVANKVDAYINIGTSWFKVDEGKLSKETTAPASGVCVDSAPAAGDADQDVWVKSSVAVNNGAAYTYKLVPAAGSN